MKKYSFVASDCNVIVSALSKKEAINKIKESGAKGVDKASARTVFIFN